jgi:ABC-type glycerol-3-phosphate transport system substrate-binding protein
MSAPRAALLLLAALALAGCGGDEGERPAASAAPSPAVTELDNVLVLRSDFEQAAGKTRVVLLFSPT